MRLKVTPHDVENFEDARITNRIEDLIAFPPARNDVSGTEDCKMLRSIRLLQL
jgi:hypothetical protein